MCLGSGKAAVDGAAVEVKGEVLAGSDTQRSVDNDVLLQHGDGLAGLRRVDGSLHGEVICRRTVRGDACHGFLHPGIERHVRIADGGGGEVPFFCALICIVRVPAVESIAVRKGDRRFRDGSAFRELHCQRIRIRRGRPVLVELKAHGMQRDQDRLAGGVQAHAIIAVVGGEIIRRVEADRPVCPAAEDAAAVFHGNADGSPGVKAAVNGDRSSGEDI